MRIFLTGATGFIGSAVAAKLNEAGHHVTGLARSDAAAAKCKAAGLSVQRGDLADTAGLASAADHDAVIHAGFSHDDWGGMEGAFRQDAKAVDALLNALAGSGKPFVYTSGSGVLADTGSTPAREGDPLSDAAALAARIDVEKRVIAAAGRGVRSVVLRPGLVYGANGGGTMGLLLDLARRDGGPFTVGEGWNVWSAVHRDDLAELYRLAVETAPAGSLFHAANEDRVTMREIAAAGARSVGARSIPQAIPVEKARTFAGLMADGLVAEKRISAGRARVELGWAPRAPSIVEDIERGSYAIASAPAAGGQAESYVTMINAFEMPAQVEASFVAEWSSDLSFMRRQPGFLSGRLYKANSREARFRYVNVAHWRDSDAFEAARRAIFARFDTDGVDRISAWKEAGVRMNAATFDVLERF